MHHGHGFLPMDLKNFVLVTVLIKYLLNIVNI